MTLVTPIALANNVHRRGLFLNTAKEQCSIHESGNMTFRVLREDPRFTLDYVEIKREDYKSLQGDEFVEKLRGDFPQFGELNSYDFTIVNYHHFTMAPFLRKQQLDGLPGRKYAIVLEVEPHDCLAFCPSGWFDGYMVLDPSVRDSRPEIYPFPRPIEGILRGDWDRPDLVPVIGSFGFGTPGKGFELLIDAVNREFDRAIVRINIPSNIYADDAMASVHGENYARYVARICKSIAKPDVRVDVTFDFMSKDDLIAWCVENTLNCFMYTRKQSGLAATTDQSVASGRPLLVSGNQTFRHIHDYIRPYPGTSLRQAIAKTGPIVRKIQEDWSAQSFRERFWKMVEATTGDAADSGGSYAAVSAEKRASKRAKPVMLVVPPISIARDSIETLLSRAVTAISDSSQFQVLKCLPKTEDGYARLSFWVQPDIIYLPGWPAGAALAELKKIRSAHPNCPAIITPIDSGAPADHLVEGVTDVRFRDLCGIVPFYTNLYSRPPAPLRISLFGYDEECAAQELAAVIAKIEREIGAAHVSIYVSPLINHGVRKAVKDRLILIERQLSAGVTFELTDLPTSASARMEALARGSMNIVRYSKAQAKRLGNIRDLALTTERPLLLTRRSPLPGNAVEGPWLEDGRLGEFLAAGIGTQIGLYNDLSEGRFVSEIENLALGLLAGPPRARSVPAQDLIDEGGWVLMGGQPSFLTDPVNTAAHPPQEAMPASALHQEHGLLYAAVSNLTNPGDGSRIAVLGDPDMPCPARLRREGFAFAKDGEGADFALVSNVIVGSAELDVRIAELAQALRPGGVGLFLTYHAEDYQAPFLSSDFDFRIVSPEDFDKLLSRFGNLECVFRPTVSARPPCIVPGPFVIPPVGLYLIKKSLGGN